MENLLWRLEQVVGKLEDFTSRWCLDGNGPSPSVDLAPPTSREEVASKNSVPSGFVNRAAGGTASWIVAYDKLISGPFRHYLKASQRIGDDVLMQASLVEGAFMAQRQYLLTMSRQEKPSSPLDTETLYQTMAEKLIQVQEFRDKKRGTVYFNHLSTISESIPALGWVTMNAEAGFNIRALIDAGQFFANRVLLELKRDPVHVDWVNAWFDTLTHLQSYASEFHPTGVPLHSLKGNENLSSYAMPLNADHSSTPGPMAPSLHSSVSAVLPTPKSLVSDRWNLKKRQSNPETNSNQRHEIEEILRHVAHGMQDLKKSVCSTDRAKSAKAPVAEPHLNPTKSEEREPNKHFFTKLKPIGLKLTNQPSEAQCQLNASYAAKPNSHFSEAFPGFNANCSHPTDPDHPTTISQQFAPASKGNSYSGNSDSQWLSSKSPSQLSQSYSSKQTSQVISSNPTNPPSKQSTITSYSSNTPSQFNPSIPTTPPSQLSLSPANNKLAKFNKSCPTKAPCEFGSSSPTIPPSQSSPACLASPPSQFSTSCHSKSSIISKAAQVTQSSQGSVTLQPPSDSPSAARATRSEPKNKPGKAPQCILNGKKWILEYHRGKQDLVVNVDDSRESVYIFDCNDCIIRVNGKTSAITIDNCKRTGLIFDETISVLEIVNSQDIQAQSLMKVPAVSVEKTDGCTVFLSRESLNARIITSKSSAVNILYPDEHGEFREFPIPEQFCSQWNGDHLVTDLSDTRQHA